MYNTLYNSRNATSFVLVPMPQPCLIRVSEYHENWECNLRNTKLNTALYIFWKHLHGFFEIYLNEVGWYFATHETITSSAFYIQWVQSCLFSMLSGISGFYVQWDFLVGSTSDPCRCAGFALSLWQFISYIIYIYVYMCMSVCIYYTLNPYATKKTREMTPAPGLSTEPWFPFWRKLLGRDPPPPVELPPSGRGLWPLELLPFDGGRLPLPSMWGGDPPPFGVPLPSPTWPPGRGGLPPWFPPPLPSRLGGGRGLLPPSPPGGGRGLLPPSPPGGGRGLLPPSPPEGGRGLLPPSPPGGGRGLLPPSPPGGGRGLLPPSPPEGGRGLLPPSPPGGGGDRTWTAIITDSSTVVTSRAIFPVGKNTMSYTIYQWFVAWLRHDIHVTVFTEISRVIDSSTSQIHQQNDIVVS